MADSSTTNRAYVLPEVGASPNTWGNKTNANWVQVDSDVQNIVNFMNYATSGGTVDAITIAVTPAPSAYAAGLHVRFMAAGPNTVSPTLNVAGLGAKAIKYADGSSLAAGALATGVIYGVDYNGTDFIIASTGASPANIAETLAGANIVKFLTAGGFAGNKLLATDGYYQFPGGLTLQWGTTTGNIAGGSTLTVNFAIAFASACVFAIATPRNPAGGLNEDIEGLQWKAAGTATASFFCQDGSQNANGANWFAVGY